MLIGVQPSGCMFKDSRFTMDQFASVIAPQSAQLLMDLEAQQDDILRQLDELNLRVEQAITKSQLAVHRAEAE